MVLARLLLPASLHVTSTFAAEVRKAWPPKQSRFNKIIFIHFDSRKQNYTLSSKSWLQAVWKSQTLWEVLLHCWCFQVSMVTNSSLGCHVSQWRYMWVFWVFLYFLFSGLISVVLFHHIVVTSTEASWRKTSRENGSYPTALTAVRSFTVIRRSNYNTVSLSSVDGKKIWNNLLSSRLAENYSAMILIIWFEYIKLHYGKW